MVDTPWAPTPALPSRVHIVTLRFLEGGRTAVDEAMTALGLAGLPDPGRSVGVDPCLLWSRPSELLLICSDARFAVLALNELRPGRHAQAYALDSSDGMAVFRITPASGSRATGLPLDAQSLPREPGQVSQTRCDGVRVMLVRIAPDTTLMLTDRAVDMPRLGAIGSDAMHA